jgi:hypothetical protein
MAKGFKDKIAALIDAGEAERKSQQEFEVDRSDNPRENTSRGGW